MWDPHDATSTEPLTSFTQLVPIQVGEPQDVTLVARGRREALGAGLRRRRGLRECTRASPAKAWKNEMIYGSSRKYHLFL